MSVACPLLSPTAADHSLLLLAVVLLLPGVRISWEVPPGWMTTQFTKLFSFILASVNDIPQQPLQPAYRMQCHSCMSGYLEDQFLYISHLYRRPLAFTEKCDQNNFDWQYLRPKNCTDACVTLRMNDKVGGRRRYGFMRGCLSDILHYNKSAVRIYEQGSSKQRSNSYCSLVRLRDLFISSDRYAFDAHDHVELCTCVRPLCNTALSRSFHSSILFIPVFLAAYFAFWMLDLDFRQCVTQNVHFTSNRLKYVNCEQNQHISREPSSPSPHLRPNCRQAISLLSIQENSSNVRVMVVPYLSGLL